MVRQRKEVRVIHNARPGGGQRRDPRTVGADSVGLHLQELGHRGRQAIRPAVGGEGALQHDGPQPRLQAAVGVLKGKLHGPVLKGGHKLSLLPRESALQRDWPKVRGWMQQEQVAVQEPVMEQSWSMGCCRGPRGQGCIGRGGSPPPPPPGRPAYAQALSP